MGIYTSECPFSLDEEGWDEGENNPLILFSSPSRQPLLRCSTSCIHAVVQQERGKRSVPLFGKEGLGEILLDKSPSIPLLQRGK